MADKDQDDFAKTHGEKQGATPEREAQRKLEEQQKEYLDAVAAAMAELAEEVTTTGTLVDIADGRFDGNMRTPSREVIKDAFRLAMPQIMANLPQAGAVGRVIPKYTKRPVRPQAPQAPVAANAAIPPNRRPPPPPPDGDDLPGPDPKNEPPVVQLGRTREQFTEDILLWRVIRDRSRAIGFNSYADFVDRVLCGEATGESGITDLQDLQDKLRVSHLRGKDAYELLKVATEAFLLQEAGMFSNELTSAQVSGELEAYNGDLNPEERRALELAKSNYLVELSNSLPKLLPYMDLIQRGLSSVPIKEFGVLGLGSDSPCYGIIPSRIANPCLIELIWSYWHEESGLIQAMNAIGLRFQNRRNPALKDPLERMAIDPLRPLNNLMWGFIEDEHERLTISRRAHEYEHEYGLTLQGRAIKGLNPVDRRSKFLQAFHTLLHLCTRFFREDDDATIFADGFPLLNSLREVHLLLSQGAHNQYGDLPWTSRSEMLIQMWLLARPEARSFLGGRVMVPYNEPWMGQLETMRSLQKWGSSPVTHFRDLAVYGESILLSIRFTAWTSIHTRSASVNWAKFWRDEIQSYIHAYRALTGVDLTADVVDFTSPSELLKRTEKRAG